MCNCLAIAVSSRCGPPAVRLLCWACCPASGGEQPLVGNGLRRDTASGRKRPLARKLLPQDKAPQFCKVPSGQKQTKAGNSHCKETTSRRKRPGRPGAGNGFSKTSKTTLAFYPHKSSLQVSRSTHIGLAETEQIVDRTFVFSHQQK